MWSPGLKGLFELLHIVTGGEKSSTSLKWIWNPPQSDDFFAPSYLAPELQTPDTFQTRHAALCNSSCGVLARGQIRFHSWILAQSGGASLPDCFSWICSCDVTETKVDFTCSSCIPMTFRGCRGGLAFLLSLFFFNSAALNGRDKMKAKRREERRLVICAPWELLLSQSPAQLCFMNPRVVIKTDRRIHY